MPSRNLLHTALIAVGHPLEVLLSPVLVSQCPLETRLCMIRRQILVAFWLATSLFVFAEHTFDGEKRNRERSFGGLARMCTPVLPYSALDSPFISFGKDLRPASPCEILNSAALVKRYRKFLTVD